MKKLIILLLLFLNFLPFSIAQEGGSFIYTKPSLEGRDILWDIFPLTKNEYIVTGQEAQEGNTYGVCNIFKINEQGEILWSNYFPDTLKTYQINKGQNGYFYLTGTSSWNEGGEKSTKATIIKMNIDGDSTFTKYQIFPIIEGVDYRYDAYSYVALMNDHRLFFCGSTQILDDTATSVKDSRLIVGMLDTLTDTLWTHLIDSSSTDGVSFFGMVSDGNFLGTKSNYPIFYPGAGVYVFKVDTTGSIIWLWKHIKPQSFNFTINDTLHTELIYTKGEVVEINKEYYVPISAMVYYLPDPSPSIRMGILKLNQQGDSIWTKLYDIYSDTTFNSGRRNDYVSQLIQTQDGNLVLGGTFNADYKGAFDKGKFYLIKTDTAGTEIWRKKYGTSQHDYLTDFVETSDGGFLMIGTTQYDFFADYDILMIKTDSLGEVSWIHQQPVPAEKPIVYPNPSNDIFNFYIPTQSSYGKYYITIYDGLGRTVYQTNVSGKNSMEVNLQQKPAGIYFYRISTERNTRYSGKLLKW